MAPPRVRSILRYIRLNLKTGYMQDKPWEFDYIRRFPPVTNVYNPDFYTIRKMDIPYFRLYEKLKRTDARYADDHVYPTHQMDEPEALTIAKQQYQYMQNGLSEDDALRKATHEMNTTENKAYIELQTLIDKIEANGAHHYQSITKDPIVKEGLETYQKVLADYPYDTLDLGQQGEIDKFIHIYLLHWNEVQREKRMKDFVFYEKYQELLEVLFPRSSIGQKTYESYLHPRIKKSIFKQLELNDIYHHPQKKFYIEDYLHFYSLFKKDPLHHTTWELKLRASFITWSRSTLLYQSLLKKDRNLAKDFNDQMEAYLFPMILFPSRCQDLPNLTLQSIKEICYHNNIGYMRDPNSGLGGEFVSPPSTDNENKLGSDNNDDIDDEVVVNETNKLYVRRFYKLPQLLFPRDHFCATIALDQPKLDAILADTEKNLLLEEMRKEGINEHLLDEIYKQLDDYRTYKESAFKSTLDIPTPLNSGEEFDILTQIHTEAAKSLESEENPLVATPQEIVDGVENVENAENVDKKEDQVVVEEEKKESIDGLTYLNSLDTSIPFDETSKQEVEQLLKNIDFTPEKLYSLSVEHKGNLPIEFLKQFEKYPKYIEYLIVESKFIYDQERLAEPVKAVLGIDIKKLIDAKNDEEIDEVFKNVKIDDIDLSLLNENDDKVEELTKTTKKPLSNTPRRYTARNQLISDEKEDKKVEKEIVEEPLQAETARLDQVLKDLTQQVEDFFKVVDPKHTVQDLNTDEDDDEDFKKYRGLSLEELKKKIDDETVENLRKEAQAERPENWNQLLKKYFFSPDTELEKERLNLYFESSGLSLDYISTEKQLQDLEIAKNQWIVKNQKSLKQQYQEKEKARLKAEWESRGFELASADEKTLNEWKEIARYSHPLAVLHAKK